MASQVPPVWRLRLNMDVMMFQSIEDLVAFQAQDPSAPRHAYTVKASGNDWWLEQGLSVADSIGYALPVLEPGVGDVVSMRDA